MKTYKMNHRSSFFLVEVGCSETDQILFASASEQFGEWKEFLQIGKVPCTRASKDWIF